jgi:cytidine deaminase
MDDANKLTRGEFLVGLAATPALLAAAPPPQRDLDALLKQLAPVNGRVAPERVRDSGMPVHELMLALHPWARSFAHPPISHFFVGAIVEGASGALYAGMNLEFPGQTLAFTVHGEGAATTNAWLHDETGIVSLAVGGVPCGYCRQFLSEFVAPEKLTIWLPQGGSITLAEALPHAFLPSVLGVRVDPFHAHRALALAEPSADPLLETALAAAVRSHAPYSGTLAGIALRLADGTIVTGRSAENVAFNPGMPPLQAALVALRLRGRHEREIAAAALVETAGAASAQSATRAVLASVSGVPLTYARAVPRPV